MQLQGIIFMESISLNESLEEVNELVEFELSSLEQADESTRLTILSRYGIPAELVEEVFTFTNKILFYNINDYNSFTRKISGQLNKILSVDLPEQEYSFYLGAKRNINTVEDPSNVLRFPSNDGKGKTPTVKRKTVKIKMTG